jgi:formylglycine-generating enzyme required for sulfatase activity
MADIFLSYASEDRKRIVPLARLLEGRGWSVFWDRKTPIGVTWDEYIATKLEVSRCVVVAWSNASVKSKWVRSEGRYGLNREAYVPLLLERVQPPFPFDQIQAADLSDWRGDAEHRELGDLVAHLRNRLDQARMTTPPATTKGPKIRKPGIRAPAVWLAAAVGILAAVWFIAPYIGVRKQAAVAVFRDPLKGGGEAPEMVVIPAGSFLMGSPQDQTGWSEDELPRHEVTIARPFGLSRNEVTFAEYDAFSKAAGRELPADQGWGRGNRPVINVSWQDAQTYAKWLSEQTGKHYRLPTEAEWEYAARAGTTTSRYWGDTASDACRFANMDDAAHGCKDGQRRTGPVGSYEANAFGVYDILGNVWEWTEDCRHENYDGAPEDGSAWTQGGDCNLRVMRGGSWDDGPDVVRSAYRARGSPGGRFNGLGFRLARTLE